MLPFDGKKDTYYCEAPCCSMQETRRCHLLPLSSAGRHVGRLRCGVCIVLGDDFGHVLGVRPNPDAAAAVPGPCIMEPRRLITAMVEQRGDIGVG